MGRPAIPEVLRFWPKVRQEGDCWVWTAAVTPLGYGLFRASTPEKKRAQVNAHRWSYEHMIGPIPDGLVLDHLCRNRRCVNPDHLDPVPQWLNVRRGESHVARLAEQSHCKRGHPFDEDNTYYQRLKNGRVGRNCRRCRADRQQERRRVVCSLAD